MPLREILLFPLPEMNHEGAILFLWRVSSMVEEAYQVVRAWGFVPKTEIVWKKLTATGKRHFGMGRITRAEHETCIVATLGRPEIRDHGVRSTFEAAPPDGIFEAEATRKHSQKPEEFFEIVEALSAGPYVELFARRQRPGWTCLGNQAHGELVTPSVVT